MNIEKIVLVTRQTRMEGLVKRFNTKAQAAFYINQNARVASARAAPAMAKMSAAAAPAIAERGRTVRSGRPARALAEPPPAPVNAFAVYEQEHDTYYSASDQLQDQLSSILKVQVVDRAFLPNFLFSPNDLVVTIGIDGLVVNTAKYLDGQLVVAVNPDPAHIDGILLPFTVEQAPQVVRRVLEGRFKVKPVSMAEAQLEDGQTLLAFNDLFIGAKSHVSARYRITFQGEVEDHSSSGVIVSTGAGSTGWLSSMFNMTQGMARVYGVGTGLSAPRFEWDSKKLVFVVREPFVSKTSGAEIVCGAVTADSPLVIESRMPEGGVIFSDGVESDFLAFNSGSVATIGLSSKSTQLVIGVE